MVLIRRGKACSLVMAKDPPGGYTSAIICRTSFASREFDGSLVRLEEMIFLDVVWQSRNIKPLPNHKGRESSNCSMILGGTGDTCITLEDPLDIASWGRLKSEGILEPRLARAMWPEDLFKCVLPTLQRLGLTFSLENNSTNALMVLIRLKPGRPVGVGKEIYSFCSENSPAFSAKWKVVHGAPPAAIEGVLALCCSLGNVQTFWRYGVVVHGNLGGWNGSGPFTVVIEYASSNNELAAQVYGDISTPAPWVALSYTISTVRYVLLNFPGLGSRGSLEFPENGDAMLLTNDVRRWTFADCPS